MRLQCATIAAMLLGAVTARAGDLLVEDIFGRRLNEHGVTLVDWEGPIANPAIKVFVAPPEGAALPARAVLTSTQPRAYFNLPSKIGPRGPSKTITFNTREKQPVFVSIFPDRDAKNLDFALQLKFEDAAGTKRTIKIPCHVIDQDKPPGDDRATSTFPIDVDFSQDRTRFFDDEKKRRVVQQAVHDWAYFLRPSPAIPCVSARKRLLSGIRTALSGGTTSRTRTNIRVTSSTPTAFMDPSCVPAVRRHITAASSGKRQRAGRPAFGRLRSRDPRQLQHVGLVDQRGRRRLLEGHQSPQSAQRSAFDCPSRNRPRPVFQLRQYAIRGGPAAGRLDDAAVRDYLGVDPKIDKSAHFAGSIDPASRCGAFGNEYHGNVPFFRWQITKLDLLCASGRLQAP